MSISTQKLLSVCLILQISNAVYGYLECCENPNILGDRRCANGKNITVIDCHKDILRSPANEPFNVTYDGSLVLSKFVIPSDRYCLSKTNISENAALFCVEDESRLSTLGLITVSCMLLSVVFLGLTIAVYFIVPELRDLQGECTLNSICGLAATFIFFGIIFLNFLPDRWCLAVAFVTYYAFLYTFFWLNILSIQIWRNVVKPCGPNKIWRRLYYLYGIGGSAVFLITLLVTQFVEGEHISPRIGEERCWFSDDQALFLYFYAPISTILSINVIIFIWISIKLWKDAVHQNTTRTKILKHRFLVYVKLFFVMGLPWIFEVVSAVFDDHGKVLTTLWEITDILNTLQGVLIFVLLVATRKRALKGLVKTKICGLNLPSRWKNLKDEESEDAVEAGLSQETTT